MTEALTRFDAEAPVATLLYTSEPALYARFGFEPVPQHAFVGPAPEPSRARPARRLDLDDAGDRALLLDRLERRAPVSRRAALMIDAPQFVRNVESDPDLVLAHDEAHDAIVVFEADGAEISIVDVVAPAIPPLATILGALGRSASTVRTLFAPDQLDWHGTPVPEETGLMARGTTSAFPRTFMFPPTVEF